jgi:hypothetical protein
MRVSKWWPGSSLVAVVPKRTGPPWGYELMVLEKNRTPPVAQRAGKRRLSECHTRLSDLEALLAFESGEIFVFGTECPLLPKEPVFDEDGNQLEQESEPLPVVAVESWTKGARRSSFAALPLSELSRTFALGPTDIWAAGAIKDGEWGVTHFDGIGWNLLPQRFADPIHSLFVKRSPGSAERIVLAVGRRLLEIVRGDIKEHEVPANCAPVGARLHEEHWWVDCTTDYDLSIYTTDLSIRTFAFPATDADKPYVDWTGAKLPKLDPKGPSVGCGRKEFSLDGDASATPHGKRRRRSTPRRGSKKSSPPEWFGDY